MLVFSPARTEALTITPCTSTAPNIICGVSGNNPSGNSFGYNLTSGTPAAVYGDPPNFLVTTEAAANSVMDASAAALNAFAATVPYNPTSPPVLFGNLALNEFKIAYQVVYTPGGREWLASRSEWVDTGGQWRIIPVLVQIPDGEVNVWTTPAPGPLSVLGLGAVLGYSRKLRKRFKNRKTPEIMSAIT